jgi:20S proteasome alpha/beta subunit
VQTKLLVPGSNKRIYTVDYHAGVASAGLVADGKHLAGRAREEAIAFRDTYRYKSPVKVRFIQKGRSPVSNADFARLDRHSQID